MWIFKSQSLGTLVRQVLAAVVRVLWGVAKLLLCLGAPWAWQRSHPGQTVITPVSPRGSETTLGGPVCGRWVSVEGGAASPLGAPWGVHLACAMGLHGHHCITTQGCLGDTGGPRAMDCPCLDASSVLPALTAFSLQIPFVHRDDCDPCFSSRLSLNPAPGPSDSKRML